MRNIIENRLEFSSHAPKMQSIDVHAFKRITLQHMKTLFSCLSQYFRIGIFMAPYKTKLFFSLSNCEYKFLTFFQSLLLILGQKFSSRFHVLFFYSKPIRTIWKVFIIIYGWQMHFSHQPTSVSTEWIPTFICLSQNKKI